MSSFSSMSSDGRSSRIDSCQCYDAPCIIPDFTVTILGRFKSGEYSGSKLRTIFLLDVLSTIGDAGSTNESVGDRVVLDLQRLSSHGSSKRDNKGTSRVCQQILAGRSMEYCQHYILSFQTVLLARSS